MIPPSFTFDVKGAGAAEGRWSDDVTYTKIYKPLNKRRSKSNNIQEALIGEHAFTKGPVL